MRNLSPAMQAALTSPLVVPAFLVSLTFQSGTVYAWTGKGEITWNGMTFGGVGGFGSIGAISEATSVTATGTTLTLSGVDPTLYADCVADLITGQPANIWLACLAGATVIDATLLFAGQMDEATITETGDDIKIDLALESRMTNLQRANRKLWTDAEQRRTCPTDSGFSRVSRMVDLVNAWG